jgi:hypothetical protein
MWTRNDQRTSAHQISSVAEDLRPLSRVAWDPAVVLLVLGVPEQDSASNLFTDRRADVCDACSSEGSTLAVSSRNESRIGTLGIGGVEKANHLPDGDSRSSSRKGIVAEGSSVSTTDTLDPDTRLAVLCFKL